MKRATVVIFFLFLACRAEEYTQHDIHVRNPINATEETDPEDAAGDATVRSLETEDAGPTDAAPTDAHADVRDAGRG